METVEHLKAGGVGAASLGAVGLVVGVLAGWWGLLRADGAQAVANAAAPFLLVLPLLLPVALILLTISNLEETENHSPYSKLSAALARLLIAGTAGGGLACLLFLVAAFQVIAVFGGEDAIKLMDALRPHVLDRAGLITGVTTVAAVGIAVWANRRASHDNL